MNKIEEILKLNKYNYAAKKIGKVCVYIINDEKMFVVIQNKKDNVFNISRDCFNEIDEELLPYSFFLIDNLERIYFYEIKEPNNSLRNAFDNSNKNIIFFGKEVLNKRIAEHDIKKYIDKM